MNRYASQLGAKVHRLRAVALVGIATMISGALLASPVHAIVDVGPIVPAHGFPAWYEDHNSLSLQPCLAAAFCLAPAPGAGPAAVPGNFPADGVYWSASSRILGPTGTRVEVDMSLNAGFVGGIVAAGQQLTFEKLRFRMNTLVPLASYTVTFPYGTRTYVANAQGGIDQREIVGCTAAPCDFSAALAGSVEPFLVWDPAVGPAAPAGFVGNPTIAHPVVGSPLGTNYMKVTGPNVGGLGVNTVQSNLFNVQGQIATANFRTPGIPTALAGSAGPDAGAVTLSWGKPSLDGGTAITGYRLYAGDSASNLAHLADLDATTRGFVDTGLGEGVTRFYEVTAVNSVGESLHSPQISVITFARPSAPQTVVAKQGNGIGETTVSWNAPAANGGTPVTSYIVYRAQGTGAYAPISTVGDVHEFHDSGLLPLTSYHYAVSAVNLVGEGDKAAPSCTRAYPWVEMLDVLLPC